MKQTVITRERIEQAQLKVADFMVNHGMKHLAPIYKRLERELQALDEQDETLRSAMTLLAQDQ